MERLKHMEEVLMGCVQAQLSHLDTVNTEELGQAIDMIKDLEQAKYYCSIVKAMEEAEEDEPKEMSHRHRDMDKVYGRMYYEGPDGRYPWKKRDRDEDWRAILIILNADVRLIFAILAKAAVQ